MKDPMLFQKIVNELEKIQWEVERVQKNVLDVNLGKMIEPQGRALKLKEKGCAFIISPKGNIIVSFDAGMVSLQEDRIWMKEKWKDLGWRKVLFENPSKNRSAPVETQISEIQLTSGKRYLLSTFLKTAGWSLIVLLPKRTAFRGNPKCRRTGSTSAAYLH